MRFARTVFAFLISIGCALALTTDVRGGESCKTYEYKGHALEGLWQYQLGSNSCTPLTGVEATVTVTHDIIVASATKGYNGFSMQLNANGPSSGLRPSQLNWQQFVIEVGQGSVQGFTQQWPSGHVKVKGIYPANSVTMGAPSSIKNKLLTIHAGTTFKWELAIDSKGNVESATYSAKDTVGTKYAPVTEHIPEEDRAPIYSLTMDIVCESNACATTFQTGAGTITYTAKSFSASYDFPSCAQNSGTGENSNMRYGPLKAASQGGFTQEFCADLNLKRVIAVNNVANSCGGTLNVSGTGFFPSDHVTVSAENVPGYKASQQVVAGSGVADKSGNLTIQLPYSFNPYSGLPGCAYASGATATVTITAAGEISGKASTKGYIRNCALTWTACP